MIPPHAGRVSGASLKIQSKIKQFKLLHPVPITLADQEMQSSLRAGVIYWEGSVSIEGTRAVQPIVGQGYV